jgi:hypothetical protein
MVGTFRAVDIKKGICCKKISFPHVYEFWVLSSDFWFFMFMEKTKTGTNLFSAYKA